MIYIFPLSVNSVSIRFVPCTLSCIAALSFVRALLLLLVFVFVGARLVHIRHLISPIVFAAQHGAELTTGEVRRRIPEIHVVCHV